jgi:SAM-dependent methyltransferase
VLNRVVGPTTNDLLARLGVAAGWRCLDVGCGGGDVTVTLAELADPAPVVGIDVDVPQLDIARHDAAGSGRTNVEFRAVDAMTCDTEVHERFDLVYARFLLTHLPEPATAVASMVKLLRPGGIVAVEDIDIAAQFCSPPSSAFDCYSEWYTAAHRARGGDPTIGRRLPRMLIEAGIENVAMNVVQPAGLHGDITQIAPLTLANTRQPIVELGIASDSEIDEALAELDALAQEPATAQSMPRIVQAWGTAVESATSVGTEAQGRRASDESLSGGSS